jgi:hypothetical protein
MNSELANLKAACRAATARNESDRIKDGESLWIAGFPVTADPGHVGLSMGEGHSVVVSESSILEVVKDGELYLVRVRAGTAALVRSEMVATLREDECDCPDTEFSSLAARPAAGSGGRQPVSSVGSLICRRVTFCADYVDAKGYVRRVCVPSLSCRRSGPATVSV